MQTCSQRLHDETICRYLLVLSTGCKQNGARILLVVDSLSLEKQVNYRTIRA